MNEVDTCHFDLTDSTLPPLPPSLPPSLPSGADISICVREALMEPLRKCKQAKYFMPNADGKEGGREGGRVLLCHHLQFHISLPPSLPPSIGMLTPYHSGTGEDPNVPPCPRCPMVLSTEGGSNGGKGGGMEGGKAGALTCESCKAVRGGLYEIEPEKLLVSKEGRDR